VVAGLVLNVAINLVLVPAWGLLGAVVSTTIATGLALTMMVCINRRAGMRLDLGMVALSIAPASLCGGVWCGSATLILLAVLVPFSRTLITQHERDLFAAFGQSYIHRLASYWSRTEEQRETTHAV
jgi:O-antigen/teichoic acid export membrane protein